MAENSADDPALTRRGLLATTAGGTAALSGCWGGSSGSDPPATATDAPSDSASPTDTPDRAGPADAFETVLHAVDDVGCDPTGEDPCVAALEGAIENGVAIRFPPGEYRFDRPLKLHNFGRVGFIGDGEARFVPPAGFNDKLVWYIGFWAHFSGIDIDLRSPETTAGLRFITFAGFEIADVEFLGRGTHPDASVTNALSLAISNPEKAGVVRDLTARRGSAIGHYKGGNGRVGVWVGKRHNGHIRLDNCRLEEFGNNGVYASRCLGTTEVVGGLFRNNNTCGVRLGGGGNVVRGATFELDLRQYSGPTTRQEADYNTRAIVTEQGQFDKAGRVVIRDCDVRLLDLDRSQGGIVAWPTGNGPRIEECRIETAADGVAGVRGVTPAETVDPDHRAVELVDSTIVGDAANGCAVAFQERPDSLLRRTTIEQSGAGRDGIRLHRATPVRVGESTITAGRYPVLAIEPAGDDRCLMYLWGESTLVSSGPAPGSVREGEVTVHQDPPSSGLSVPDGTIVRCADRALFDEVDDPSAIAITGLGDRRVTWTHYTDGETAVQG